MLDAATDAIAIVTYYWRVTANLIGSMSCCSVIIGTSFAGRQPIAYDAADAFQRLRC